MGFSLHCLADIPEALDLARRIKSCLPDRFVFSGGHGVSLIAEHVLEQAGENVDAVIRGEGEPAVVPLLRTVRDGGLDTVPGVVTPAGRGPPPRCRTASTVLVPPAIRCAIAAAASSASPPLRLDREHAPVNEPPAPPPHQAARYGPAHRPAGKHKGRVELGI